MPAHPHAELMALYAKDATETDKPWERWEWFHSHSNKWLQCSKHPSWQFSNKYRRKPDGPWYRVALFKNSIYGETRYTLTQNSKMEKTQNYERDSLFVKWLTDRVYYDAE